jgi:hypothetical protein
MPGNDATRKKSAGRTKIETINPNAGVLPFNLIQTFASGSYSNAIDGIPNTRISKLGL